MAVVDNWAYINKHSCSSRGVLEKAELVNQNVNMKDATDAFTGHCDSSIKKKI